MTRRQPSKIKPKLLLLVIVALLASAPLLLGAKRATSSISVTVVNNSGREIRHFYFSVSDQTQWGPDQLNNSAIGLGGSHTFSNVSCEGSGIKLIAEDQDGCFITRSAVCSENASWTITTDAPRDCGD